MEIVQLTWWVDILFKDKIILSLPDPPHPWAIEIFLNISLTSCASSWGTHLTSRTNYRWLWVLKSNISWLTCRTVFLSATPASPLHILSLYNSNGTIPHYSQKYLGNEATSGTRPKLPTRLNLLKENVCYERFSKVEKSVVYERRKES
jgi:hypothetical protein